MKDAVMKKINFPFVQKQTGVVTVLVALTLPVLVGAAALAVDLAYLHVVRSELQNDADAAALAGARKLYVSGASALDWAAASSTASSAIALNRASGHALANGQVQTGYWDTSQTTAGLQALPLTPSANDAPAVQVSLGKSDGQNQGPARTFLASMWGIVFAPVHVIAVAGVSSPGSVALSFPVAISQCMYQKFWDMSVQPPAPRKDPQTGNPFVFKIGSLYHYENCDSGQWTPLNFTGKGTNLIDKIVEHAADLFDPPPAMLSIGDSVFMDSGTKASMYKAVEKCIGAKSNPCDLVVMPVLDQVLAGTQATIRGFACLKILDAKGGSDKYILVQMSNQCPPPMANGIGPNYGVVSPPSLFK
jgi:Flp pilus assembly protein TadG